MLFVAIAVIFVYSVLSFGAVLPHSSFFIAIALIVTAGFHLITSALRRNAWRYSDMALIAVLLLPFLVPARLAIGFAIGFLGWAAAIGRAKQTLLFFRVLILVGVFESLVGMIQYFVTPGWIFGYINTVYPVSGTLINHNHFAGLLEMLIPVTFGFAYITAEKYGGLARPYLYLLVSAFMGLALIFSSSRMGIFSFFITLCFMGALMQFRKSQHLRAASLTLTVIGLVIAGGLWLGIDNVLQRYSFLLGQDGIFREGRIVVFRDTARLLTAHPWGIGVGMFQDRFREYQTFRPDLLFDHAHNEYLETAVEWGMPLAIGFWCLIGSALVRAARLFISTHSAEIAGICLVCIGGMFSILVHSLADFNLEIPSNALLFFTLVGFSFAMPVFERESTVLE
jgi:hypothetical protein